MSARDRLIAGMIEATKAGYHSTSIEDVVHCTGLSPSDFHTHFSDMEGCLVAALRSVSGDVYDLVRSALEQASSDEEPSHVVVEALLDFSISQPNSAHLLARCSLCAGVAARDERDALIKALAATTEQQWRRRGHTPGPDIPAIAVVGALLRWLALKPLGPEGIVGGGITELKGLAEVMREWIDSYAVDGAPFRWRGAISRDAIEWIDSLPLPTIAATDSDQERIVRAVARRAFEVGYPNVGLDEVLMLAEASRETFDSHFPDLDAAAYGTADRAYEVIMSTAARLFFGPGTWAERICLAGAAMQEDFHANPDLMHLTFVELHAVSERSFELAHDRLFAYTLMLEEGFTQSPTALAFPRAGAEAIASALMELSYLPSSQMHDARQPNLIVLRTYICLAPFIGARGASELLATGDR